MICTRAFRFRRATRRFLPVGALAIWDGGGMPLSAGLLPDRGTFGGVCRAMF